MTQRPVRLLYFVPTMGLPSGVFSSQVLAPARVLERNGIECMVVGSYDKDEDVRNELFPVNDVAIMKLIKCAQYPGRISWASLLLVGRRAQKEAWQEIRKFEPNIVYTRGIFESPIGEKMSRSLSAVHVHDVRGLIAEESRFRHGRRRLGEGILRAYEIRQIRKATCVVCVSNKMAEWISSKVGRTDVRVIPCCVDTLQFGFCNESRKSIRTKLGWGLDSPVVVYSGGVSRWQRLEDVMHLLSKSAGLCPNMKMLFITSDPAKVTELALRNRLNTSSFFATQVPHSEVHKWLSVGDMGIILRHDLPFNNVASPIKIAEYLACGLGVICTEFIGDFSELIQANELGCVLKEIDDKAISTVVDFLRTALDKKTLRDRAIAFAKRHLDWSLHIDKYLSLC
jgi:glycosyltransferase involved in cell wall biosynthesis